MDATVKRLIEENDGETLLSLLHDGKCASVPSPVKAEWARLAASLGRAEMLRLLCERCHGMPLEKDGQGRSLMHYAASSGDRATLDFVIHTLGMSATEGDLSGITPLDMAKKAGHHALQAIEEAANIRLKDCYRNPIQRGFHPDPSVVRVGNDYYMVNSSFVMVPALPISHSKDLIHWETVSHVFTDPGTARLRNLPGGHGYWAPDISYYKGRFWVVATLRTDTVPARTQMITSAPTPQGPWDAPKFLDVDGIDPSLFTDDDGQRYLLTNPGVQIAPISDAGDLKEPPRMIWYGWNRIKSEGPHLLKKDGWYYLFQAEGGTGFGHAVTCARSRSLYGPYESCPFNPILSEKNGQAYIRRGGHGKPVQLPDGRWALMYLCGRRVEGKTLMGRETAVDPLEWTKDGWPMVNGLQGPSCLQKKLLPDAPVEDRQSWICPRLSPDAFSSFSPDGYVRVNGGASLNDLNDAHLLLHRQTEACFVQQVQVDVNVLEIGGMAGLTGYYDENSYYFFALRRKENDADVVLIQRAGTEAEETCLGMIWEQRAMLTVSGSGLERTVQWGSADQKTSLRIDYLTDEGLKMGKRFTGALLGIATVGKGGAVFREYREEMGYE